MKLFTTSYRSVVDTLVGLNWVYTEMLSSKSKRRLPLAYCLLLCSTFGYMSVPLAVSGVIDSISKNNIDSAEWWLIAVIGCMFGGMTLKRAYDFVREHIWNNNYLSANIATMSKLLRQPVEILMSSKSDIGAEHAESIKDRVQNILYLFLFEISTSAVTIIGASLLMFWGDVIGALVMLLLTCFNIIWFFICNAEMNYRMKPIDKQFRRAQSMLIERVTFATSVKGAGVEKKVEREVERSMKKPLDQDLRLWAFWWQKLEFVRESVNVLVPGLLLVYGTLIANWTLGTISAMSGWIYLISQQYTNLGHMMRHLTSNIARLKAARIELSKEPEFHYDQGIHYQPKGEFHEIHTKEY